MKRVGLVCAIISLGIGLMPFKASAINPFEEMIRENAAQLSASVADPFTQIFSTGITGGIYRSAATHGVLGFDVGLRAMFVIIPSGESSVFDTVGTKAFPVPMAQVALGLPMDAEVMLRGFGVKYKDANVSLLGVGIKKNFKPLIPIPMFPDVAAMISYHRFKGTYTTFNLSDANLSALNLTDPLPAGIDAEIDAGNLMKSSHWSFDLIVSKKLGLLLFSIQPYIGLGFDRSSMDYEWTIVSTAPEDISQPPWNVTLPMTISGTSTVTSTRFTVGLDISPVPFVHIFGDYNFGKFPQATAGLAISFR